MVREALLAAGVVAPEIERLAVSVTSSDGKPRFVWTDTKTDLQTYARVILDSVMERARWRSQYDRAKTIQPALKPGSATAGETGPDG